MWPAVRMTEQSNSFAARCLVRSAIRMFKVTDRIRGARRGRGVLMTGYLSDSTFWYYLGHRAWDNVTAQITESIHAMNARAREVGFPVEWTSGRTVPWATVCRVHILSKQHLAHATKAQFGSLCRGCSASIQPRGFFEHALRRVLGNIDKPALPSREPIDSLADTFAAASMNYTIPDRVAESIHPSVLE